MTCIDAACGFEELLGVSHREAFKMQAANTGLVARTKGPYRHFVPVRASKGLLVAELVAVKSLP
jgi:hypothetical protein